MPSCRYCKEPASFHITVIEGGSKSVYHVCSLHATHDQPRRHGVMLPPSCPKCGAQMYGMFKQIRSEGRTISGIHCAICGHQSEPPRPRTEID